MKGRENERKERERGEKKVGRDGGGRVRREGWSEGAREG